VVFRSPNPSSLASDGLGDINNVQPRGNEPIQLLGNLVDGMALQPNHDVENLRLIEGRQPSLTTGAEQAFHRLGCGLLRQQRDDRLGV
jgi:hypothetical protein